MEFLYICDTWHVPVGSWHSRTNAKHNIYILFVLLDVRSTIPPRPGDLRNTRYVFSWSRKLKNSGSFCVGQVPGTSHVATRPKKHTCGRRMCPSLSRPFAAGPASSLFVVVQSVLDVICIPGATVTTVVAPPVLSS